MSNLISRQSVIDKVKRLHDVALANWKETRISANMMINALKELPSAQPDNQVHLCDSCRYVYPECPSEKDDVIFGNRKGNDNICACNKYEPFTRPTGKWELLESEHVENIYLCSKCRNYEAWGETEKTPYCPYCGARMEV